jgi:tetratricopeptide (TPR) repeat protein
MAFYSISIVFCVLSSVLYRIYSNQELELNIIDILVLAFLAFVFASGIQSGFGYFTLKSLFSWLVAAGIYYVFCMSGPKLRIDWFQMLFCSTLCSKIFYDFKFLSASEQSGAVLMLCTFICVFIGLYLVMKAENRFERMFFIIGILVLVFRLQVTGESTTISESINKISGVRFLWGNGPGYCMSFKEHAGYTSYIPNCNAETMESIYELILLDFGMLGLCIFLGVCLASLWRSIIKKDFIIAFILFVAAIYLFYVPYTDLSPMLFWAFTGLGNLRNGNEERMRIKNIYRSPFTKYTITLLIIIIMFLHVSWNIIDVYAQGLVVSGNKLQNRGFFTESLESYRQAVVLTFKDPIVYSLMGKTFLAMDMHEEAVLLFKKAVEHGSNGRLTYMGLIEAYLRLGREDLALHVLQQGTEFHQDIDVKSIPVHVNMSCTSVKLVEFSEIKHLKYENGVLHFEAGIRNMVNEGLFVMFSASVCDFAGTTYFNIDLGNVSLEAEGSFVLGKSLEVSVPQGIYVLKILLRCSDETDEITGYFTVSW